MAHGGIYIGVGGWVYEPWRGTFYPPDLPRKDELAYLGTRLTATEINATYYRLQNPKTFAGWAKAVPERFRFTVKGSRFCTNRRVLAEAGESVEKFVRQGIVELGEKLGPILWQFAPVKRFDPDDFGAFLGVLPGSIDGVRLRHAVEVRHESFADPAFLTLARGAGVTVVLADHPEYPRLEADTTPVHYIRVMQSRANMDAGYDETALDGWAQYLREKSASADAYLFCISGAKERNPAAAQALIDRISSRRS